MNNDNGAAIVLVLFVWGLAGALFGSLFAGLHHARRRSDRGIAAALGSASARIAPDLMTTALPPQIRNTVAFDKQ